MQIIGHQETIDHLLGLLYAFDETKGEAATLQLSKIVSKNQKVAYLRALVIHSSIYECVKVFIGHEEALLNGTLQQPLTDLFKDDLHKKWKALQQYSYKNIYTHAVVMEREMAGYKVLQGLLEEFTNALLLENSHRNKQIQSLIPYAYKNISQSGSVYLNIRSILDFISAMTDQEAVNIVPLIERD